MNFLILYEHKVRELENVILLKTELENRGYSVSLCNIYDDIRIEYLFGSKPEVIITPWLYSDTEVRLIMSKFGKVSKLVNLQWEQVLSKKWEINGFHNPKGYARNAYHICWGQAAIDRLVKNGVNESKTINTGPLQMDFLNPDFSNYYFSKKEISNKFGLDHTKKWVLYVSSFTLPTMSETKISAMEKRINTSVSDYYLVMKESKEETLQWIKMLLKDNEDIIFIYRAHPNEITDRALIQMELENPRFRIISDLSVKQWIIVSDLINTWFSTAVAEIFYANKTCNILRPIEIQKELDPVIYENAKVITTYDEFRESCYNLESKRKNFPLDQNIIRYHYQVDFNSPAYIQISNFLESILKEPNTISDYGKVDLILRTKYLILKYVRKLILFLNLNPKLFKFMRKRNLKLYRLLFEDNNDIASNKEIDDITNKIKKINF